MEVKIWGVTEGPISIDEVSDQELEMAPEGSKYFMVCRTEIDGIIGEDNFWFEDFDDAYEWKREKDMGPGKKLVDCLGLL